MVVLNVQIILKEQMIINSFYNFRYKLKYKSKEVVDFLHKGSGDTELLVEDVYLY